MNIERGAIWLWRGEARKGVEAHCLDGEARRAREFRAPGRRLEYLCGRAAARLGAAGILGADPRDLRIWTNEDGRPAFEGEAAALDFSLSHSKGRVAVVFALGGRVGVDVETGPSGSDVDALAGRFFLPREREYVAGAADGEERRAAFRRIWACKEALAKCSGRKLWQVLGECEVAAGEHPARVEGGYWLHEAGGADAGEACVVAADFAISRVYSLELPLYS